MANKDAPGRARIAWWPLAALAGVSLAAALMPESALRLFDVVGYAVCHRIPDRSFFVAGAQLPLCARDTGMFTTALLGVLGFCAFQPARASLFPTGRFRAILLAFAAAWAFDGANSYLLLARGEPFLYQPQNWLRLVTGALMGAAMSAFVVPLFNTAIWQPEARAEAPSVGSWRDLLRLVLTAGIVIAAVLWRPDFLRGPLAALSALGAALLLVVVNALLIVLVLKREAQHDRWPQLALPLAGGAAFTVTEILMIGMLRAALTQALGLPF
jgi:uncharacterized membrane protein